MEENIITLKCVYKITKTYMEPAIDPQTGRYPSVVRRVNASGDAMLLEEDRKKNTPYVAENEVIEIYDGKTFDLDDPYDKVQWEAIKYSPRIAQDRSQRDATGKLVIDGDTKKYGTAEYYVERAGQESKIKNTKKRDIHDAKTYIYADSQDGLYQKARLLNNPMNGLPINDVEEYLIGVAESKPEKIKQLYTGTDMHLRMLLLDAIDKRVIFHKDKVYIYGDDIILGPTQDSAILWMKNSDNKRILDHIKKETYPDLYEADAEGGVVKKK